MKLLIIEDELIWHCLLKQYLPDIDVAYAVTMKRALQMLAENDYDLLLLDVRLPDTENGMDSYRRIRACKTSVPIVAFSGANDGELARMLSTEGTHFIRKDTIAQAPGGLRTLLESAIKSFHGMASASQGLHGQV